MWLRVFGTQLKQNAISASGVSASIQAFLPDLLDDNALRRVLHPTHLCWGAASSGFWIAISKHMYL